MNRKKLLSQGFVFSQTLGRGSHRLLALAAYDCGRRDDTTLMQNIDSQEAMKRRQEEITRALRDEVALASRDGHSMIFSSEHVHSRLTKLSEIERLKQVLAVVGINDITVIVYLRRPASIAASLYSTAIKAGGVGEQPPAPSHKSVSYTHLTLPTIYSV